MAEALWHLSPRRGHLSADQLRRLTESLAGSELFGHLQGSFTDARRTRSGKFRMAHGGTLFLDEVGDLPLSVQPRLLRAVEQGEIEPVGGDAPSRWTCGCWPPPTRTCRASSPRAASARICTTGWRCWRSICRPFGNGVRTSSAGPTFCPGGGPNLWPGPAGALHPPPGTGGRHSWPGNVRELENVITRAVLLSAAGPILPEHIHFTYLNSRDKTETRGAAEEVWSTRPNRGRLMGLLNEERGNITALSRRLKVRQTVYRWLKSYQIDLMSLRGWVAYLEMAE